MRKADLVKNHVPFDTALSRYRKFMERVIQAQRVLGTAQEKRDLAESILLRLTANWESFIDEQLVDCINKDYSKLCDFFGVRIPANPSKDLCHALLFGERYRDFHSFAEIVGFSKKLLPENSNPFIHVTKSHQSKIDEVYKIRNYLSHYSSMSKRSLMDMYKKKYHMINFFEPGMFLLSRNASKLWSYFDAFEGASSDMKAWYNAP